VPQLDRRKLDREFMAFEPTECEWSGGYTLEGHDWGRLCDAKGVERLLHVESVACAFGGVVPDGAFPSRRKAVEQTVEELPCRYSLVINASSGGSTRTGAVDLCPGRDRSGNPTWPATTQLAAFDVEGGKFAVKWQLGQMARKPKTWEEWGGSAIYLGGKRPEKDKFDYQKYLAETREKEEKEKQEAIQKGVEEALKKM
jgi:hypothetical protein